MVFCNRCGTYSAKGTTVCPRCQADLSMFGHESMTGSTAALGSASSPAKQSTASRGPAVANLADYGSFIGRLSASIVDGIIIIVGITVLTIVAGLIFTGLLPNPQNMTQVKAMGTLALVYAAFALLPIIYEVVMIGSRGATFGKAALKLIVVRTNGEPVSMGRSVLRVLIKMFLSSILAIGYLMALFTAKNQSLHDLIADTVVVRSRG